MTYPASFSKQPAERYPLAVDYRRSLPPGDSLASGTVTAYNVTDSVDATTVVLDNPATVTISGSSASFVVMAGSDGKEYRITLSMTTTLGYSLEDDITMTVTEG